MVSIRLAQIAHAEYADVRRLHAHNNKPGNRVHWFRIMNAMQFRISCLPAKIVRYSIRQTIRVRKTSATRRVSAQENYSSCNHINIWKRIIKIGLHWIFAEWMRRPPSRDGIKQILRSPTAIAAGCYRAHTLPQKSYWNCSDGACYWLGAWRSVSFVGSLAVRCGTTHTHTIQLRAHKECYNGNCVEK